MNDAQNTELVKSVEALTCRRFKTPTLSYEAGCHMIDCGQGCHCRMEDGDRRFPTQMVTEWVQKYAKK